MFNFVNEKKEIKHLNIQLRSLLVQVCCPKFQPDGLHVPLSGLSHRPLPWAQYSKKRFFKLSSVIIVIGNYVQSKSFSSNFQIFMSLEDYPSSKPRVYFQSGFVITSPRSRRALWTSHNLFFPGRRYSVSTYLVSNITYQLHFTWFLMILLTT